MSWVRVPLSGEKLDIAQLVEHEYPIYQPVLKGKSHERKRVTHARNDNATPGNPG